MDASSTPEAHFSGLTMDDIADIVAHAMSPADLGEYTGTVWLDLQEELVSSVDWTSSSKAVDLTGISVSPAEPSSRFMDTSTCGDGPQARCGDDGFVRATHSDYVHMHSSVVTTTYN